MKNTVLSAGLSGLLATSPLAYGDTGVKKLHPHGTGDYAVWCNYKEKEYVRNIEELNAKIEEIKEVVKGIGEGVGISEGENNKESFILYGAAKRNKKYYTLRCNTKVEVEGLFKGLVVADSY